MYISQRLKRDQKHVFAVTEMAVTYEVKQSPNERDCLKTSLQVANYIRPSYGMEIELREKMYAIYLNSRLEVLGVYRVSEGGINGTLADIRLILSIGLVTLATNIILVHNHPSAALVPSREDKALTEKLKNACGYMQMRLADHIILSGYDHYSFSDEGVIL